VRPRYPITCGNVCQWKCFARINPFESPKPTAIVWPIGRGVAQGSLERVRTRDEGAWRIRAVVPAWFSDLGAQDAASESKEGLQSSLVHSDLRAAADVAELDGSAHDSWPKRRRGKPGDAAIRPGCGRPYAREGRKPAKPLRTGLATRFPQAHRCFGTADFWRRGAPTRDHLRECPPSPCTTSLQKLAL
jgi:hypothetical protein